MASNNGKEMPTFSESWMEGLPDRRSYIQPILDARYELSGLNEKKVRDLAMRLDAAIKAWKLDQGAPLEEVLGHASRKAPRLTREATPPSPYHKSDLDIILENKNHPLLYKVPYRQRIALLILKAAEKHDSDTLLLAKSALDVLRSESEKERLLQATYRLGVMNADHVRKKRMADLNKKYRHKDSHAAMKLARETFSKMLKKDGPFYDTNTEDIALAIQVFLIVKGFREYALDTIWNDWIKDLEPSGRKAGRRAGASNANSKTN